MPEIPKEPQPDDSQSSGSVETDDQTGDLDNDLNPQSEKERQETIAQMLKEHKARTKFKR
jgi:hypothetical protein